MLPNQGQMINILAVVMGRFGTADGSFCAWFQSRNEGTPHRLHIYNVHFNLRILIMTAFLISRL